MSGVSRPDREQSVRYYVHSNLTRSRARLHERGCSFIRLHGGTHKYDQASWEEFATKAQAMRKLMALKARGLDARTCPRCAP